MMVLVEDALESALDLVEGADTASGGRLGTDVTRPQAPVPEEVRQSPRLTPRTLVVATGSLVVVIVVAITAVVYWIGPLVHERSQRGLLSEERTAIDNAAKDNEGLFRPKLPTLAPSPGSVVGILAIPVIGLQQAVVEGVKPSQTVMGPGHVPGTAGLGQPGNAAVVGRRSGYGGAFGQLGLLKRGDRIVTATTEGQTVYRVSSVRTVKLVTTGTPATTAPSTTTAAGTATTAVTPTTLSRRSTVPTKRRGGGRGSRPMPTMTMAALYGQNARNEITLVTSGSATPWNTSVATVVVAHMVDIPYPATPQEALSTGQLGNGSDPSALAWFILELMALIATFVGAVALYRRVSLRSAYLLSTAPLLLFTILAAESASHLLPAWL